MKFGSWPPPESAPLRIGTLRSGAVSSSWTWNLLSFVFIAACFTFCACLTGSKYRTERHGQHAKKAGGGGLSDPARRARSRRPPPPGRGPAGMPRGRSGRGGLARDPDRAALEAVTLARIRLRGRGLVGDAGHGAQGDRLGDSAVLLGRAGEATAVETLGNLDLALPLEQNRFPTHSVVILPQGAGTGCLHRLSLFSPAGLADGLALKESRYTDHRDSPQACRPSGSPTPHCQAGLRLGWTRPCYQQSVWLGRKSAAGRGVSVMRAPRALIDRPRARRIEPPAPPPHLGGGRPACAPVRCRPS